MVFLHFSLLFAPSLIGGLDHYCKVFDSLVACLVYLELINLSTMVVAIRQPFLVVYRYYYYI